MCGTTNGATRARVVVWLIGLFAAWCIGYAARDRPDPAQHSNLAGQLARVRLERADPGSDDGFFETISQLVDADRPPWSGLSRSVAELVGADNQ